MQAVNTGLQVWRKYDIEDLSDMEIPRAVLKGAHDDYWVTEILTLQGNFYVIHSSQGSKSGYFVQKRKWYALDIVPDQPMRITRLKGIRVKRLTGPVSGGYIMLVRTRNAENIPIV